MTVPTELFRCLRVPCQVLGLAAVLALGAEADRLAVAQRDEHVITHGLGGHALEGVVVVELAETLAGEFAGGVLADLAGSARRRAAAVVGGAVAAGEQRPGQGEGDEGRKCQFHEGLLSNLLKQPAGPMH